MLHVFWHNPGQFVALAMVLLSLLSLGCSHTPGDRERPFSGEWAYQRHRDAQKRLEQKEYVLMGDEKGARAAVEIDKKGKPRLNIGKSRGLSADIDIDSDEAEVGLKYKIEWGGAKSDKPKPVPEGHRTIR